MSNQIIYWKTDKVLSQKRVKTGSQVHLIENPLKDKILKTRLLQQEMKTLKGGFSQNVNREFKMNNNFSNLVNFKYQARGIDYQKYQDLIKIC